MNNKIKELISKYETKLANADDGINKHSARLYHIVRGEVVNQEEMNAVEVMLNLYKKEYNNCNEILKDLKDLVNEETI